MYSWCTTDCRDLYRYFPHLNFGCWSACSLTCGIEIGINSTLLLERALVHKVQWTHACRARRLAYSSIGRRCPSNRHDSYQHDAMDKCGVKLDGSAKTAETPHGSHIKCITRCADLRLYINTTNPVYPEILRKKADGETHEENRRR